MLKVMPLALCGLTVLWLCVVGCDDGATDGDGDADGDSDTDVDGDADGDSDDGGPPEVGDPVSATIGAEGGEVELPDGTALVVAPGVVTEDTVFTITPVPREPTIYDERYVPLGTAFRVTPYAYSAVPRPFDYRVPSAGCPEGRDVDEIRLVVVSEGILYGETQEGIPETELGTIHPLWVPDENSDETVTFRFPATFPATFQAIVPDVYDESEKPGRGVSRSPLSEALALFHFQDATGLLQSGGECSAAVSNVGLTPPADIDEIVTNAGGSMMQAAAIVWDDNEQPDVMVDSVKRFVARACLAAYRSQRYYHEEMGFFVPALGPGEPPPRLTIAFHYRGSSRDERCRTMGEINAAGLEIYLSPICVPEAQGWVPFIDSADWNSPPPTGVAIGDYADRVEHTVAHELFHYLEDWSNLIPGDRVWGLDGQGIDGLTEGGAVAAAQEVYDSPNLANRHPAQIWELSAWGARDDVGDLVYRMNEFWRYVDWRQGGGRRDDHPLKRILDQVILRATGFAPCIDGCPTGITSEDVDLALRIAVPTEDFGLEGALASFAGSHLYLHDYERHRDGCGGDPALCDRYADVLGEQLDEDGASELWGTWGDMEPSPDTVADPMAISVTAPPLDGLPFEAPSFDLTPYTSRAVTLDLTALAPSGRAVLVTLSAVDAEGAAPFAELAARMYRRAADGEEAAELRWSLNEISTIAGAASGEVVLVEELGDEHVLVLTNVDGSRTATITIGLAVAREDAVVLTGEGLTHVRLEDGEVTRLPIAGDPTGTLHVGDRARGLAVYRDGLRALATDWQQHTVAMVALEPDAERELDQDPDAMGVNRYQLDEGSRPYRVAVTADSGHAFVTLYYRQEVVVLGIDDDRLVECERFPVSQERPYDIVIDPDDRLAYVSLEGTSAEMGDRIVVVDVARATDCVPDGGEAGDAVLGEIDLGVRCRPGDLQLSPQGDVLAISGRETDRILIVHTGTTVAEHFVEDFEELDGRLERFIRAAQVPTRLAFQADGERLYYGHETGAAGSVLAGDGTVRFVHLPPIGDRSRGHDAYDVGISNSVRGLLVSRSGGHIYVGDDNGNLTVLTPDLWASGLELLGDHTGGCWDDHMSNPVACPPALDIGTPISEMVWKRP